MKRSPIARTKPPRRVNRKRKASEFTRAYGSKKRVAFVGTLPCIVGEISCRGWLARHNHHIENGGAGRKSDAQKIVPLCNTHHEAFHRHGRDTFQRVFNVDLEKAAAKTESAWQAFQGERV